jgi:hypothetical protein
MAAGCWIGNWPSYKAVAELQIDLIVLSLLLYAWLTSRSSVGLSASALAAAVLLKLSPVLPAGFVALTHRRTWTLALVAALAIFIALSVILGPTSLWTDFADEIAGRHWSSNSIDTAMIGLAGGTIGAALTILIKLAILAYAVLHLWNARKLQQRAQLPAAAGTTDVAFALGICCMVVLSPVVWGHHRVWLVPAIAFAWVFCHRRSLPVLAVATALALWIPMPADGGIIVVLLSTLGLLWCLRPDNLVPSGKDSAFTAVGRILRHGGLEA